MKFTLLTCMVSPHQLPLTRALLKYWHGEIQYQYTTPLTLERSSMGWEETKEENFTLVPFHGDDAYNSDALLCGLRMPDLFKKRLQAERWTGYMFERWLKPPWGILRLFWPPYFHMAKEMIRLGKSPFFHFFPIGIHAARDLVRLEQLLKGNLKSLFFTPILAFESKPGGSVVTLQKAMKAKILSQDEIIFAKKNGFVQIPQKNWGKVEASGFFSKLCLWGYFVSPGQKAVREKIPPRPEKLLWVGRMVSVKKIDTIIQAVNSCRSLSLNLYGHGPIESKLKVLAAQKQHSIFHDFVPISQVRNLMRIHDTYIFASNAYEGWGAVVSEALEEGMRVFASMESGAGSTILPKERLFRSGDVSALKALLQKSGSGGEIGPWTADEAARTLVSRIKEQSTGEQNA